MMNLVLKSNLPFLHRQDIYRIKFIDPFSAEMQKDDELCQPRFGPLLHFLLMTGMSKPHLLVVISCLVIVH